VEVLRSFEDVFQEYLASVSNSGSGLTIDSTQGSFAYTLARAAASVLTLNDQRLQSLYLSSNPATAIGPDLDSLGSGYQILRGDPQVSVGFCLAISTASVEQTISPDTLLVNLENGLQYFVSSDSPISVPTFTEVRVPIKALQPGQQYNASSSTALFCPTVPNVLLTVGTEKLSTGEYYGDLVGGQDWESDSSYRLRILNRSQPYSSNYLVEKLLELPKVNRAFVSTRVGGVLEVWVDSLDLNFTETEIQAIMDYILPYCSPGIIPVVIKATRRSVNLILKIQPLSNSSSLDDLTERIRDLSNQYFNRLSVNEPFLVNVFTSSLRPLVRSIEVVNLNQDIKPKLGEILIFGDFEVTYPVF
jgi:uncharacterized phage protein gp47/JayE